MNPLGFVALTVYMKRDVAEVSRLMSMLVRQPLELERFNVHFVPSDVSNVNGLERAADPVIRVAIIATARSQSELERTTKALNRLVTVLKVVVEQS